MLPICQDICRLHELDFVVYCIKWAIHLIIRYVNLLFQTSFSDPKRQKDPIDQEIDKVPQPMLDKVMNFQQWA